MVSVIFSHVQNVREIKVYLPTFGFILADSGTFRTLAQLGIFMCIKAYSEPMVYSAILTAADIFSKFQKLLEINSCIF